MISLRFASNSSWLMKPSERRSLSSAIRAFALRPSPPAVRGVDAATVGSGGGGGGELVFGDEPRPSSEPDEIRRRSDGLADLPPSRVVAAPGLYPLSARSTAAGFGSLAVAALGIPTGREPSQERI